MNREDSLLDIGALHTANCTIAGALLYAMCLRGFVVRVQKVGNKWDAFAYSAGNGEERGQVTKSSMTEAIKSLYDYLP